MFSWEQVLNLADRALYRARQSGRNRWVGVLESAAADPTIVMQRKDDDLGQLARDGILELHTGAPDPNEPDRTYRRADTRPGPELVEHTG
ncbi:MAG: hypothetical protein VX427_12630 [Acidobacteriota bacterium]|nr:hypothetical protein [Acidobacteriota bacterium]